VRLFSDGFAHPRIKKTLTCLCLLLQLRIGTVGERDSLIVEKIHAKRSIVSASSSNMSSSKLLNNEYPDTKLNDAAREIRLLTLSLPRMRNLSRASFGQARPTQSYEALSYAWGNTTSPYVISLNGVDFNVGENLFHAFSHLREYDVERVLWVDAICINQSEISERNHQVQQMAYIYS
jgi:hypothetical protein